MEHTEIWLQMLDKDLLISVEQTVAQILIWAGLTTISILTKVSRTLTNPVQIRKRCGRVSQLRRVGAKFHLSEHTSDCKPSSLLSAWIRLHLPPEWETSRTTLPADGDSTSESGAACAGSKIEGQLC